MSPNLTPDFSSPPPTAIKPTAETLLKGIAAAPLSILCGRNNSGKSYLLRKLLQDIGEQAYYLGPGRYFNFNMLTPYNPTTGRRRKRYRALVNHFKNASQNMDNSPLDLGQAIAELTDAQRDRLFSMLNRLLGSRTSVELTVAGNSMSQRYVRVEDYNLAFQSSGFRLAATLLTCLLDEESSVFIVDEPELGLSPEAQGVIADFLFDPEQRAEYFPHLTSLVLATHSPIFLNRRDVATNYFVSRVDSDIDLRRLETIQDMSGLQFLLLGNRLETLFLPSAIILVEGKSDHAFITRLLALRYPKSLTSVVQCGSDGRMPQVIATARTLLGDVQRSPYHNRIFCILDAVHGQAIRGQLDRLGVGGENVVVWKGNGIEFVYPEDALREIFGAAGGLDVQDDSVTLNGVSKRKNELAELVSDCLTDETHHRTELKEKLLKPLDLLLLA